MLRRFLGRPSSFFSETSESEKIRKLHSDIGGFGTLLAYSHEWEPRDKWIKSMTILAEEVIPSLSDL